MSESVFVDAVHTNDFADSADVPNPPRRRQPSITFLRQGKMIKVADGIEFPNGTTRGNRGEG